jgi:hypothetical protein
MSKSLYFLLDPMELIIYTLISILRETKQCPDFSREALLCLYRRDFCPELTSGIPNFGHNHMSDFTIVQTPLCLSTDFQFRL